MRKSLLSTVALAAFGLTGAAHATGTLVLAQGTDVSGTTELFYYVVGGRYSLLGGTSVNTTVASAPYAYASVFYLPAVIPMSAIVVMNQAGTVQSGVSLTQVIPIGTATSGTPTVPTQLGDIGGMLLSASSSDVSGTTEYVWSDVGGVYTLLGSGSVNANPAFTGFAYNVLFYLPSATPLNSLVVTNQAGTIQTGYTLQQALPRGLANPPPAATVSRAVKPAVASVPGAGQLDRAQGTDVSGTTEYVWYHIGATYTLLGSGPVNATDPKNPYKYNVLFFLPQGCYARNVVVTNQAAITQHGAVLDFKTPTIVPPPV
jgi:hypothetical protein